MFIIHPDFRKSKCLQIFHRQAPAGETIYHAADFQIAGLENFCHSQISFDILIQFSLILKFFLCNQSFLPGIRIPPEDLLAADIDKGWLLLNVILELLKEIKKLIFNRYVPGYSMDFDGIQLCSKHLFLVRI